MADTTEKEDIIDDKPMPLMEHLLELRTRLMWSVGAFVITFIACYHWSARIYLFLAQPLADVFHENGEARKMIYTSLTEAFFTYMKVAAFGAAFFSFPIVASQLWMFVAPRALSLGEARHRALPAGDADPVHPRRLHRLLLRHPRRLALLHRLRNSGLRQRPADRAAAQDRRVSRPGDEADPRLRRGLPAPRRPQPDGQGRHHHVGRPQAVPPLRRGGDDGRRRHPRPARPPAA